MDSFETELMCKFPLQVENGHVIDKEQAMISVLTHGVTGKEFNFQYKMRESEEQIIELGNTVIRIAKVTPGGILLFFSSYNQLEKTY